MCKGKLSLAVIALAAGLPGTGCALLGESEARRRWRDAVETPVPPPPTPAGAAPIFASREEEAIRQKDGLGVADCQRLAVLRSERLGALTETVLQAELDEANGWLGLLPNARYTGQWFRQEAAVDSPFTPNQTRTHRFTLSQPIFKGFRDWVAIAASRSRQDEADALVRAAKIDVALACGRAFFDAAALERVVETLASSLALEDDRLREIRAREAAGISRKTETLLVETDRTLTEADLARARHDLAAARARLGFYTGFPGARLVTAEAAPTDPGPLARWIEASRERPDLRVLSHEVEARRREVLGARFELLPSMNALSNLYAHREGFFETVHWDVQLELDWPLDLRMLGDQRRADSRLRQTERERAEAGRRAEAEVESAYQQLLASLSTIPALEARVRLAEENVKLLEAEYRAGIATNLEVVSAENTRREARLALERERFLAHRLALELRAAAGDETLAPGP